MTGTLHAYGETDAASEGESGFETASETESRSIEEALMKQETGVGPESFEDVSEVPEELPAYGAAGDTKDADSAQARSNPVLNVTYPASISCDTPVTFTMDVTGGSGSYLYKIYSFDIVYGDGSSEMLYDISRSNFEKNNTFTFTFRASGTYKICFIAFDPTSKKFVRSQEYTLQIRDSKRKSVEQIADEVAAECKRQCQTEYEKAVWLHDWVLDHVVYDNSLLYCSAEGVFARGVGTCESYHRAYVMLLNRVGIESGRVAGNGHVWTAVKLDGSWCQVDPTWNDVEGYGKHMYFGLTDELISLAHPDHATTSAKPDYKYVSAALENNYFIRTGEIKQWSEYFTGQIKENIKNGQTSFVLSIPGNMYDNYETDIIYHLAAYQLSKQSWDGAKISATYKARKISVTVQKPTTPTDPVNPTDPTTPTDPANPTDPTTPSIPNASIRYRTHVQSYGDQGWRQDGQMSGTEKQSKRLEGIYIELVNPPAEGSIQYRTHIQSYGWEKGWKENGKMSGTSNQAKRLEAIQIRLTGRMAELYDVYYRVHAQSYGWLGWAKNGVSAGTAGYAKRLEAIEIRLVKKGEPAPGSSINSFKQAGADAGINYRTHVQSYGWQAWKSNGEMSGTSGKAKRLEGIEIKVDNLGISGSVQYKTHIQSIGWEKDWKQNGKMSGTSGKGKRLEAIQIQLTGELSRQYDVYYRVHAQSYGWLGWAKNGGNAGTAGYGKRLEGIEIRLVEKGGPAPGPTKRAYVSK